MVFSGLLFTTIEMHPISHLLPRRGNMIQHLRTIIVILLAFLETLEAPVPTCAQTFKTILMQMVIVHKSTPTDYLARLLPNAVQRVKEIQNVSVTSTVMEVILIPTAIAGQCLQSHQLIIESEGSLDPMLYLHKQPGGEWGKLWTGI
jgi:hypothetical protein